MTTGPHILSDILISSPIITGGGEEGTVAPGTTAPAGLGFQGVDPNMDPELALALKMSLEEERARQEAESKRASETTPSTATDSSSSSSTSSSSFTDSPASNNDVVMTDVSIEDEERLLAEAIAMSMSYAEPSTPAPTASTAQSSLPSSAPSAIPTSIPTTTSTPDVVMQDLTEEQEMQLAMQMSVSQSEDVNKLMEDPQFVSSVLMSLPGVDPNDERVKSILDSMKGTETKEDKK